MTLRDAVEHGLSVEDLKSGPAQAWRRRALAAEDRSRDLEHALERAVIEEGCAVPRPPFLRSGDFVLHSGAETRFLVDCDSLTDEDVATAAFLLVEIANRHGGLKSVEGVPRGGLRLAAALEPYCRDYGRWHGLADDVYTTGSSLRAAKEAHWLVTKETWHLGLVIVARTEPPAWVKPLLRLDPGLT